MRRNDLSYGLRKNPGEVHARDSTCVLIESGSNENHLEDNNCTHGGDGIFIRVLNGWVSTGNVLERNDCSYANNNGFEAWSPRNVYRHNKANHCSYGFWLGASDQTVLDGNEASYNGDPRGFHNSPHLPGGGHAGIVFMFGPSSHTICPEQHLRREQRCGDCRDRRHRVARKEMEGPPLDHRAEHAQKEPLGPVSPARRVDRSGRQRDQRQHVKETSRITATSAS